MIYRKAKKSDIDKIAKLVTKLLGTCNIDDKVSEVQTEQTIFNLNKQEISKTIDKYVVCVEDKDVIGCCGLSDVIDGVPYGITDIKRYKEILYLVVNPMYQRKGIGTKLLNICCSNESLPLIYEAWGDIEGGYVNSKFLLERCDFRMVKDLGTNYYKCLGYCPYCVNRGEGCRGCFAQIYVKNY